MEQTALAPTTAGSALGWNADRKRLSRVALAATCQAIMRMAARIAWRAMGEGGNCPVFMHGSPSRDRASGSGGRGRDRPRLFPRAPLVLANDGSRNAQPDQRQDQVYR